MLFLSIAQRKYRSQDLNQSLSTSKILILLTALSSPKESPTLTTNSLGALYPTNRSLRLNYESSMVPGTGAIMKKSPVPAEQLGRLLKIPVLKFLLHSASYLWFLIFLLGESLVMETQLSTFRGRSQSVWENSLHMIWVTGFLWFECKEVWIEGLRSYLLDWWNFLDMVILSLYLAAFALRLLLAGLAHMHCQEDSQGAACHYFTTAERSEWHTEDPQFLAEVLFAVTSMLSFTRLAYILPAHESLGTLQISIGKMIDDMIRCVPALLQAHSSLQTPLDLLPKLPGSWVTQESLTCIPPEAWAPETSDPLKPQEKFEDKCLLFESLILSGLLGAHHLIMGSQTWPLT
ncbi:short transient receptor potential channel 2-like [Saimiri boliviensis]|uniref:short transient receptor potential channel 2-like n=1 Tax=Saimiri boliviensis TaxID=27679 RepID=UPI003D7891D1